MMYNDVDTDLPSFNDPIDGDEIFLFSNTKTSSTGASFLNDDDDDHLRHQNNVVASTSSHHLPVDVDELLLNSNFLEQPDCDTTADPLFWNCKDISDDQLNEIWPQSQLSLNSNNISNISNNNNTTQHNNNINLLNPTVTLAATTSLTNCNNTQQNGIVINHQQSQHLLSSQIHQHSQTIIPIQQQQQQHHGIATLLGQQPQLGQSQHLQIRLQQQLPQSDQLVHQQALHEVLHNQQSSTTQLHQQAGFQQPQQIIQHVDQFQNKWITVVQTNDHYQTFNTIQPQHNNQHQQVAQFFDKIPPTIMQGGSTASTSVQNSVANVLSTSAQSIILQTSDIQNESHLPQQQPQQQQQQHVIINPIQHVQVNQQEQPLTQAPTIKQEQPQQSQQQPLQSLQTQTQQQQSSQLHMQPQQSIQVQQQQPQQPIEKAQRGEASDKVESKTVPDDSDAAKKEAALKFNKPKEKQTRLDCPYCKRCFSKNFDLQQHMRCHTGEKPFQCIVCGRGFAQKSNVKKHMQAHKVWPEGPNIPGIPSHRSSARNRNNSASSSMSINRDDECMQENESVQIKNELLVNSGTALGLNNDRKNDGNDLFAENRYSCSYCQFNGKTYFELKSHLTIHKREKVFKCIVSSCGKTFSGSDLQGFLDHVTGHKDLIYHCHLCSSQFYSLDEFGEHQKHHSNAQMKKSAHTQSLTVNQSQQQTQIPLKMTNTSLRQLNQQVTGPTQLQAQQNQRLYNQQQPTHTPQQQPTQQPPQHLQQQPQPQMAQQQSTQQQQQQTETPPAQTQQPPGQANNQKTTKVLGNAKPRTNQKFFRCSKCMNRYTTQTALDHHLSISTHNFPCTECNKVFMCERYLRRHLNTHTAVQHVCSFCDKQFKTAAYLKMHSVVHTGEKPFRCNQCEAAFNRRDKLSRHKLTHETVKKFKCPFKLHIGCTKEFNRPDKLKAHVLTHSGVRPHPCDSCDRTFSRLSRLREHKKLHHDSNNNVVDIKAMNAAAGIVDNSKPAAQNTNAINSTDSKNCMTIQNNNAISNVVTSVVKIEVVNSSTTISNQSDTPNVIIS